MTGRYLQARRADRLLEADRRIAPHGWRCRVCEALTERFALRCPRCASVGSLTLAHDATALRASKLRSLDQIGVRPVDRVPSGTAVLDAAFDRKGVPRATMTLIGGKRGCGKSTISLQAALLARAERPVYLSSEESPQELSDRLYRLRLPKNERLRIGFLKDADEAIDMLLDHQADFAVIDSLQKFTSRHLRGVPGGVQQTQAFTNALYDRVVKRARCTLLAVARVTQNGARMAGGSDVEYQVDNILMLQRVKKDNPERRLRVLKARYDPERAVRCELLENGLFLAASSSLLGDPEPENDYDDPAEDE